MTTLFGNLSNEGLEQSEDRLGGFTVFETDGYDASVKMFYATKSDGGANGIFLILDIGGKEYRETLWITGKDGKNYYMVKDRDGKETGKKKALMGYEIVEDLCSVTLEKSLSEMQFEEKVVNVYDSEAGKEVPKSVMVATEILGSQVTVGLEKSLKFKTKKVGNEYVETTETREENAIVKVFEYNTKLTMNEVRHAQEKNIDPVSDFYAKWVEKNKGKIKDMTKKGNANAGKTGKPGQAPQAGEGEKRQSLFGKK